jgi:hypothetical protein
MLGATSASPARSIFEAEYQGDGRVVGDKIDEDGMRRDGRRCKALSLTKKHWELSLCPNAASYIAAPTGTAGF